jgi:hypothetical protein
MRTISAFPFPSSRITLTLRTDLPAKVPVVLVTWYPTAIIRSFLSQNLRHVMFDQPPARRMTKRSIDVLRLASVAAAELKSRTPPRSDIDPDQSAMTRAHS